jgi:hypothetical protein
VLSLFSPFSPSVLHNSPLSFVDFLVVVGLTVGLGFGLDGLRFVRGLGFWSRRTSVCSWVWVLVSAAIWASVCRGWVCRVVSVPIWVWVDLGVGFAMGMGLPWVGFAVGWVCRGYGFAVGLGLPWVGFAVGMGLPWVWVCRGLGLPCLGSPWVCRAWVRHGFAVGLGFAVGMGLPWVLGEHNEEENRNEEREKKVKIK